MKIFNQFAALMLAFVLTFAAVAVSGCAASDEVVTILGLMAPAAEGLIPIVALSNPSAVAEVTKDVGVFEGATKVAIIDYNDWKTANASAQPTLLAKVQTDLGVIKADLNQSIVAAQVNNPTKQAWIDGLAAAILDEAAQVVGVIAKAQANGGTTAAVAAAIDGFRTFDPNGPDVMFAGRELPESQGATKSASVPTAKKAGKVSKPLHTARQFKAELKAHFNYKTGDANFDAVNAATAKRIK